MFNSIGIFKKVWQEETASTIACLENLTDDSLSTETVTGYRTIGRLVNHIVDTAISIPHEGGLPVSYEKKTFGTIAGLTSAYKDATAKVTEALSQWNDEVLQEDVMMYGETWKKGFALWVTVVHQSHHRGQLTVLMRIAGLKVPGVYGPSKEEWEGMGLPKAD